MADEVNIRTPYISPPCGNISQTPAIRLLTWTSIGNASKILVPVLISLKYNILQIIIITALTFSCLDAIAVIAPNSSESTFKANSITTSKESEYLVSDVDNFLAHNFLAETPALTSLFDCLLDITADPVDVSACVNSNASFSITATSSGEDISYQWRYSTNNGSTWNNVTNGATYSGATTSTLNISNPGIVMNGYLFRCIVDTDCADPVTSNNALLTVYQLPTASISGSATICNGGSANLSVTLTGASPWSITYSDGSNTTVINNIGSSPHTFVVSPSATTTYTIVQVTDNNGCSNTGSGSAIVTVMNQPAGPTLLTKNPNLGNVCNGQSLSATFNAGSGGVGCNDQFQFSTNNGGSWSTYTPGSNINSAGASTVIVRGRRAGCSAGSGCNETEWVNLTSWNVMQQPAAPSLQGKLPNITSVCNGHEVSATFNAGTGGVSCEDDFRFSINNGSTWAAYNPGSAVNTSGGSQVIIQGRRINCTSGAGCSETGWVSLATWIVVAQPAAPTLQTKTPNLNQVCDGRLVSATIHAGTGGFECTDEIRFSTNNGTNWSAYTPGSNINTTGATVVLIEARRYNCNPDAGCQTSDWASIASWTVLSQPQPPSLQTNTPDLENVCSGQQLSATFNAGTGGVGCNDQYQYSINNGSNWNTYSPGNSINTGGATIVLIQGRRTNCTNGAGCNGTEWTTLASWTINAQPVAPTLQAKQPNLDQVCSGQQVSATFNPGSGGVGCTDQYQYSTDNGSSWNPYTPGNDINTSGATVVLIQARRADCQAGAGCNGTAWATLASWTVVSQPSAPALLSKSPNEDNVCSGQMLSATFNAGSGGVGCSDEFQFSTNNGSSWNPYTAGSNINSAGASVVIIQGRRTNCNASAGCSNTSWVTLASWTVYALPVAPAITKDPNVESVCTAYLLTIVANPGSGGAGTVSDEFSYSVNNGASWSSWETDVPEFTAVAGVNLIRSRRVATGPGCNTSATNSVSWTVVAQPSAPTLTKNPNVAEVCAGQMLTVTSSNGSGGTGQTTNQYSYSTNDGASWSDWSESIPSFAAVVGTNLMRSRRIADGLGCNESSYISVSWQVMAQPVAPTLTKDPDVGALCAGTSLTVITSPGSGGTGTTTDQYRYSINGGASWVGWGTTAPSFIAVTGSNIVESRRTANGTGCSNSASNSVSWEVFNQPAAPSLTKVPNSAAVCEGQLLTVNTNPGNGGTGSCSDEYRYSTNDGVNWSSWSTAVPSFNAVTGVNLIESRRLCDGTGCNASVNQVSWNVTSAALVPPSLPDITGNTSDDGTGNCTKQIVLSHPDFSAGACAPVTLGIAFTAITPGIPVPAGGNVTPGSNNNYNFHTGITLVSYQATDAGGNSSSVEFTVTIVDDEFPSLSCPANISQGTDPDQCTATINTPNPVIGDNCEVVVLRWNMTGATTAASPASGINYVGTHVFNQGTTSITYRAEDAAGNFVECSYTIGIIDDQLPVIICPNDTLAYTPGTSCRRLIHAAYIAPIAYGDNCGLTSLIWVMTGATTASSPPTGINFPPNTQFYAGETILTYTITDVHGNVNSCSFEISINDNVDPVVTCPVPDPSYFTDPGVCHASLSFTATATDNCTMDHIKYYIAGVEINFPYNFPTGTTNVTVVATDASTNTSECIFVVNVVDNQPPTFTLCPANQIRNAALGLCTYTHGSNTWNATATDNCSVTSLAYVLSGVTTGTGTSLNGVTFNKGVTNVAWTATDASGNSNTCNFTITINDNQPPSVQVPSPNSFIRHTNADACSYTVVGAEFNLLGFGDNCEVASVTYLLTGATTGNGSNTLAGIVLNQGNTNIRWTVTDGSGNFNQSCVLTVVVTDNVPPVFLNCESQIYVPCPDNILPPDPLLMTAVDNCSSVTIAHVEDIWHGVGQVPGFCPDSIQRIYSATDVAGNIAYCSQMIIPQAPCGCQLCQSNVPHFWVDLSAACDMMWESPSIRREGLCCEATSPECCVSFSVKIGPNAVGFYVLMDGASPPGWYFQVDCGEEVNLGDVLCVPSGEYYTINICKPGANQNVYTIVSVCGLIMPDGIDTRIDCEGQVTVAGVEASTITYSNITGDYLHYLSGSPYQWINPNGHDTIYFTPDTLAPSIIKYLVCGGLENHPCAEGGILCDTLTVRVFPKVEIILEPDYLVFCTSDPKSVVATATPSSLYEIGWFDIYDNLLHTGPIFMPTESGEYYVMAIDTVSTLPCSDDILHFQVSFVDCLDCPLEDTYCSTDEILELHTYDAFIAAGGDASNFPCEPVESSLNLVEIITDGGSCPEILIYRYAMNDICGNRDTCNLVVTVHDIYPPTFELPGDTVQCVANIYQALYNPNGTYEENTDLTYPRPNYFLLYPGDARLNILNIQDYCAPVNMLVISWEIDFGNTGTIDLSGNGQLSGYTPPPPDEGIYFPMGLNTVTYTVTDICGNATTASFTVEVHPRPDIQDNY